MIWKNTRQISSTLLQRVVFAIRLKHFRSIGHLKSQVRFKEVCGVTENVLIWSNFGVYEILWERTRGKFGFLVTKNTFSNYALHKHNLRSRLYEFQSRHTSSDTVGDERRHQLKDLMERTQPFDLTRVPVTDWAFKPSGSPFAGLTVDTMADYITSVRRKFMLNYPTVCPRSVATREMLQ